MDALSAGGRGWGTLGPRRVLRAGLVSLVFIVTLGAVPTMAGPSPGCHVEGTVSWGRGGTVPAVGTVPAAHVATVTLNDAAIISHNEDGGVSIESGRLVLNDSSSIRGNRSTYPGGGVWLSAGVLILNDQSSISGNSAGGLGGGVASFRARPGRQRP